MQPFFEVGVAVAIRIAVRIGGEIEDACGRRMIRKPAHFVLAVDNRTVWVNTL